jgi:hypothetical protein
MDIRQRLRSPIWNDPVRRAALSRVVAESVLELEADIKTVLNIGNQNARGKTVKRGRITAAVTKLTKALGLPTFTTKKGKERAITGYKFHRQSLQGDPPATDSGGLIGSIEGKPIAELKGRVSVGKKYGQYLDNPAKLNRPFFRTTVERFKPKFKQKIREALR